MFCCEKMQEYVQYSSVPLKSGHCLIEECDNRMIFCMILWHADKKHFFNNLNKILSLFNQLSFKFASQIV